jgi:hypothetical protein
MVQRMGELDASSRNPGMLGATQLQRLVNCDTGSGLVEALVARENEAGQDQRLRLGAALDQAALDQGHVQALLRGFHDGIVCVATKTSSSCAS